MIVRNLHNEIYESLRLSIIMGDFVPGQVFSTRGIADRFGTSLMPARDAMKRLVAERGLELLPNRSFCIPKMSRQRFQELLQVRMYLESVLTERVYKEVNGERHEPIEMLTVDLEEGHQGGVMQALGERKAELANMEPDGRGRVRLEYRIPARGLIGFQNEFLNLTRGTGLASNIFDGYEAYRGEIASRKNGVLISMDDGEIVTYALGKLDDRGRMFVRHGDPVYEGMIVGIHSRDNDLVVNAVRQKQLTNFRVSGKEDAIKITPPIELTLEYAVEFIEDDELVEITPKSIRLRKRHLKEHDRKRASRTGA